MSEPTQHASAAPAAAISELLIAEILKAELAKFAAIEATFMPATLQGDLDAARLVLRVSEMRLRVLRVAQGPAPREAAPRDRAPRPATQQFVAPQHFAPPSTPTANHAGVTEYPEAAPSPVDVQPAPPLASGINSSEPDCAVPTATEISSTDLPPPVLETAVLETPMLETPVLQPAGEDSATGLLAEIQSMYAELLASAPPLNKTPVGNAPAAATNQLWVDAPGTLTGGPGLRNANSAPDDDALLDDDASLDDDDDDESSWDPDEELRSIQADIASLKEEAARLSIEVRPPP